jgi:SAM-dependent methyltransferase
MPATSVTSRARAAGRIAAGAASSGLSQNFLGAPWVAPLVTRAPERARPAIALRMLALSPHYFYARDLPAEADRNRRSRQAIAEALILPQLTGREWVVDYGCGPGFMARAVSARAAHVAGVDISAGVLACARVLNSRPNISYLTPAQLLRVGRRADLGYSFAVIQHLRDDACARMLAGLSAALRPGATLLLHFAEPGPDGWRTEAQWAADRSVAGRARLRYGLHCFGRTPGQLSALVTAAGFTDVRVTSLAGIGAVPGDDDITRQQLLTARRDG